MKSVPRCASSKRPTRLGDGARERALRVAEQLRLGERLGNGRRVEGDEPLIRARAVVVDRPRDQFLAGAGLALNQHGAVHRRHELQALEHRLHRGALADDVVEPVPIAQLRAQLGVLLAEPRLVDRCCEHARQMRELHGLMRKSIAPRLIAATASFDAAEAGHHDRHDLRVAGEGRVEDVEAVGVGQLQIDDQAVVGEAFETVQRFGAGGRLRDGEPFLRQMFRDDGTQLVIVFHDEHTRLGA